MRRRWFQFSLFHLLLVLTVSAALVPILISWWRLPPENTTGLREKVDVSVYFPKGFKPFQVVVDPNEVPTIEMTFSMKEGGQLRLLSRQRRLRDTKSGEIIPNSHQVRLSLEYARGGRQSFSEIWSLRMSQSHSRIVAYTDPYGFTISDAAYPTVALAFFDDQLLYFAEIDLHHVQAPSASSLSWESFNLSPIIRRRFGHASWEPQFIVRSLSRDDGIWKITFVVKGQSITLLRTEPELWIEYQANSTATGR